MTIRSILLAGAALLVVGCSPSGSPVPKTDEEKLKVAQEIAGLTTDPKMFDQLFDSMTAQVKLAGTGGGPGLCAGQKDVKRCEAIEASVEAEAQAFTKETMDATKAMMPDMMNDMAGIMARTYTGEELAKMHDFYASPEGKAITAKQPQVSAEFMPAVMKRVQPLMAERAQQLSMRLEKARTDAILAAGPAPK